MAPALAIFHRQEPGNHALVRSRLDAVHAAPDALIHVPQHHLLNRHGMSCWLPCPAQRSGSPETDGKVCPAAARYDPADYVNKDG